MPSYPCVPSLAGQIDALIDRTRTENDASVGGLKGGAAHTASSFNDSVLKGESRELDMHTLQGQDVSAAVAAQVGAAAGSSSAAPPPARTAGDLANLEGMLGGGTMADIADAWEAIAKSKRQSKSRFNTVKVAGVGEVQVLRENDYEMGDEMPNAAGGGGGGEKKVGRQLAGRDFLHEDRCLCCWKGPAKDARAKICQKFGPTPSVKALNSGVGGGLRGCDLCPAAFHLKCIGMNEADAGSWGTWACPHHACTVCGRKAAAVGGLLFRCSVSPVSYCEDHLPADALIMGENPRFQALGAAHPKQGCYILSSPACVAKAAELGFDCGEANASAAAILGATGVDTTAKAAGKGKQKVGGPAAAAVAAAQPADTRTEMKKLTMACPNVAKALRSLLGSRRKAAAQSAAAAAGADGVVTLASASWGFHDRAADKKEILIGTLDFLCVRRPLDPS